jgi:hypothetical protein
MGGGLISPSGYYFLRLKQKWLCIKFIKLFLLFKNFVFLSNRGVSWIFQEGYRGAWLIFL